MREAMCISQLEIPSEPQRRAVATGLLSLWWKASPAEAFENRVNEFKGPKTSGPRPAGIGVASRAAGAEPGLLGCPAKPNCVSSAAGGAGSVKVRSASRVGYSDYGVNAKRLNRIAEDLVALDSWRRMIRRTLKGFPG